MSEGVRYHTGKFPPENLDWGRLVSMLEPVATNIARFDSLLSLVPNSEVLLSPLKTTEATASCRIEGTIVTLPEVLAADSGIAVSEKKEEIREVQNYRLALKKAVELMIAPDRPLPLSGWVLKEAHAILLDGQPGSYKRPGEYRTGPVQIGNPARFWPIETEYLEGGMSQWEKYVNREDIDSKYVQLAIIHAEFESLHPFMDGNGRMGRMLVPLFLFSQKLLSSPTFYVSEYIEEHRQKYYDALLAVSRDDEWTGWCEFFLKAMEEQGKRNAVRAEEIINSYKEKKDIMRREKAPGGDPTRALDFFFEKVEFNSKAFREESGMPDATANRLIKYCVEKKWLECTKEAKGRSPATYSFTKLREIIG